MIRCWRSGKSGTWSARRDSATQDQLWTMEEVTGKLELIFSSMRTQLLFAAMARKVYKHGKSIDLAVKDLEIVLRLG